MKKIEDYLHLYIPFEGYLKGYPNPMKMTGLTEDSFVIKFSNGNTSMRIQHLSDFKPLLRPLSSMTEDEMLECGNMIYDFSGDEELNKWQWRDFDAPLCVEQFHWLLQRHFDLFGLIESGLALDKTKYTNNGTK